MQQRRRAASSWTTRRRSFPPPRWRLGAAVLPAPGAFAEEIYRSDVSTYDTSKLADEWEGFLPERKVTRGGKNIVITQEFGNKKKNGLAVYEGNLILTAYMEGLGKDYWSGARVLSLVVAQALGP